MITDRKTAWLLYFLVLSIVLLTFLGLETLPAGADGRTVRAGIRENAPTLLASESGSPPGIFIDIIEKPINPETIMPSLSVCLGAKNRIPTEEKR